MKVRMARQEFLIVRQRRIFGELLRDPAVSAEKLAKAGHIPVAVFRIMKARFPALRVVNARSTTVGVVKTHNPIAVIFVPVKAFLTPHERIRIVAKLLANIWMSLQILL